MINNEVKDALISEAQRIDTESRAAVEQIEIAIAEHDRLVKALRLIGEALPEEQRDEFACEQWIPSTELLDLMRWLRRSDLESQIRGVLDEAA